MLRTPVLFILFIFCVIFNCVFAIDDIRVVVLADGAVKGDKYWNGEFYEFYGIPYATAPTGRDRFQAPLPPEPWQGMFDASKKKTICKQCYISGDNDVLVDGEEDCLLINLLVPHVASETNLVPVVVYIHSGAFSGGSGNMANYNYLVRHDVIAISFNYRLGALGFACLGNKEIPGNAALKDQVAALRWINKNIKKFGGDPNRVTLAGFSVGATMAELLSLSKAATGLFNKIILDSGSALAPFAINRDPISTAKNIAISLGYNGTMSLEGLTEFYLNATVEGLAEKSVNYYLKNSTFGFAPCIENVHEDIEPILTESPLDVLKKGENNDVAVLIGFADKEGLSRSIKFGTWREDMNEEFSDFLPADLLFDDNKARDDVVNEVKKYYFDNKPVKASALPKYVDYFSDSMFKYSILKSAKLHASASKRPVYLYEFSYTGKLNIEHNYRDRIKGASHRDQTAYILDFFGYTNGYKDLDTRDRMTTMWTDFVKYEDPTAFESSLINTKWLPYTNNKRDYMEINKKLLMKKDLFEDGYNFWNKVYEKYYWTPTTPKFEETKETYEEKDTPKDKNTPKGKDNLNKKDTLKENDTPKETKTSTEKDIPKENDTTKKNNTPKQNSTPKEEDVPKEKDTTKENSILEEKNAPSKQTQKENYTLEDRNTPKEEKSVKEKDTTKKNNTPKENSTSKEKDVPKENNTPKEKNISGEKNSPSKHTQKENDSSKDTDTPKEKESVKEKYTTKKNNTPKENSNPKEKDFAKENNTPKEKNISREKNSPSKHTQKENDSSKDTDTPKEKESVKEKYTTKKNNTPKENSNPKEKDVGKENNTPKEKNISREKNSPSKHTQKENDSSKYTDTPKEKESVKEQKK